MPTKKAILKTIDQLYKARVKGDISAVENLLAPRAKYRLIGGDNAVPELASGAAKKSIDGLIDLFKFHSVKRLSAIVEGNSAAIHSRVKLSTKNGGTATTELFDLWEFGKDGKATSLTQFCDTALLERMVS